MANALLWFAVLTSLLTLCTVASCVVAFWRPVSRCGSLSKTLRETREELTEVQSALDSLTLSHKRLMARVGMRSKRGQLMIDPEDTAPAPAETKADLRRRYLNGKNPAQIAREAMQGTITTNGSSAA